MRLDQWLVENKLTPSRAKAQELIKSGSVEVLQKGVWQVVEKTAFDVGDEPVRLRDDSLLKFVSRGGLKLEGALLHLRLGVRGVTALDVGISTGGFADCLLQRGASRVVGIDAGTAQLSEALKGHPRLTVFENRNIRDAFSQAEIGAAVADVEFCVVDVSFISLDLVLPELAAHLPPHRLLALIKPQFELSAGKLTKGGLVKDEADVEAAKRRVTEAATASGYKVLEIFPSVIKGGDGNQEFFLWAHKNAITSRCENSRELSQSD